MKYLFAPNVISGGVLRMGSNIVSERTLQARERYAKIKEKIKAERAQMKADKQTKIFPNKKAKEDAEKKKQSDEKRFDDRKHIGNQLWEWLGIK